MPHAIPALTEEQLDLVQDCSHLWPLCQAVSTLFKYGWLGLLPSAAAAAAASASLIILATSMLSARGGNAYILG